jgi:hypothetical protein
VSTNVSEPSGLKVEILNSEDHLPFLDTDVYRKPAGFLTQIIQKPGIQYSNSS